PPEFFSQISPRSGRGWIPLNLGDAPAIHSSIGSQNVEEANADSRVHNSTGDVAFRVGGFLTQRGSCLKANEGQESKYQPLENANPTTQSTLCAIFRGEGSQIVVSARSNHHGEAQCHDDGDFDCSQDHTGIR